MKGITSIFCCLFPNSIDLTLTQRMEYLSRAAICAKSSTMKTAAGTEGEFLHELEEKMEVFTVISIIII